MTNFHIAPEAAAAIVAAESERMLGIHAKNAEKLPPGVRATTFFDLAGRPALVTSLDDSISIEMVPDSGPVGVAGEVVEPTVTVDRDWSRSVDG